MSIQAWFRTTTGDGLALRMGLGYTRRSRRNRRADLVVQTSRGVFRLRRGGDRAPDDEQVRARRRDLARPPDARLVVVVGTRQSHARNDGHEVGSRAAHTRNLVHRADDTATAGRDRDAKPVFEVGRVGVAREHGDRDRHGRVDTRFRRTGRHALDARRSIASPPAACRLR